MQEKVGYEVLKGLGWEDVIHVIGDGGVGVRGNIQSVQGGNLIGIPTLVVKISHSLAITIKIWQVVHVTYFQG